MIAVLNNTLKSQSVYPLRTKTFALKAINLRGADVGRGMPAGREIVATVAGGPGVSPVAVQTKIKHNRVARAEKMDLPVLGLHVDTLARGEGSGGVRLDELSELADISEHLQQTKELCHGTK
jgi:hypothetical protein